jgi:hypothetical protein
LADQPLPTLSALWTRPKVYRANSKRCIVFDGTGVTPAGVFTIATPYAWELSNLYITGEVTLTAIPEPTVCILVALALVGVISWPARRGTVSPLVRPNYSG